jgi:hypothetical protein
MTCFSACRRCRAADAACRQRMPKIEAPLMPANTPLIRRCFFDERKSMPRARASEMPFAFDFSIDATPDFFIFAFQLRRFFITPRDVFDYFIFAADSSITDFAIRSPAAALITALQR